MTFSELYDAVSRALPDQSFSVSVEAWLHRHEDGESRTLEWQIWDGHETHAGPTPEVALSRLQGLKEPEPAVAAVRI